MTTLNAGEGKVDIVQRLEEACVGHPHAKIPWPHRLLHDAVAEIVSLRQRNDELTLLDSLTPKDPTQ